MEVKIISQVLRLEFDVSPTVNHYLGIRSFIMNGRPQASIYVTTEAKKYKKRFIEYIKQQIQEQQFQIKIDKFQFTHVDATWYFPRIDLDSNNQWKLILDSLTEAGVWMDDNTTLERCKRIYYDNKNPRMILEIYYSEQVGIFDNQSQLEKFTSNCIQCKRYKDGKCSIYKKALESRIQEEIQNMTCTKFNRIKGESDK